MRVKFEGRKGGRGGQTQMQMPMLREEKGRKRKNQLLRGVTAMTTTTKIVTTITFLGLHSATSHSRERKRDVQRDRDKEREEKAVFWLWREYRGKRKAWGQLK